ncbi:MAG: HipA domain-containing protein [Dongiaceae bacterium]
MEREVLVHVELGGRPLPVGRLWGRGRRGKESAGFEYDRGWLARPERFALGPALQLGPGPFVMEAGKLLLGPLGDSAPDRWGRMLMRRAERRQAARESRPPRTLWGLEYLLLVDDEVRQGALRFAAGPDGPWLAEPGPLRVPPLLDLPRLLVAADRVAEEEDSDEDLRLLLAPGSSLGGARPKASVRDEAGGLSIAKFPHRGDEIDAVRWEAATLALAAAAGLAVPDWRLIAVAGRPVLLLRRFDRVAGSRIPFLSAMSLLGAGEGETRSYLEIADALRQHGAEPREDLEALWRRIVFNLMVSNGDDHLRNHGFLYQGPEGWRLAPAYDLNPVPTDLRPRVLSTAIDLEDATASLELALGVAEYFGLPAAEAARIAGEVGTAVAGWREAAAAQGLPPAALDRMASAFEHEDLAAARLLAA